MREGDVSLHLSQLRYSSGGNVTFWMASDQKEWVSVHHLREQGLNKPFMLSSANCIACIFNATDRQGYVVIKMNAFYMCMHSFILHLNSKEKWKQMIHKYGKFVG